MEHGLNTERESALMALEKEEITEKISPQFHLKDLFWESVFRPCSIRGSGPLVAALPLWVHPWSSVFSQGV